MSTNEQQQSTVRRTGMCMDIYTFKCPCGYETRVSDPRVFETKKKLHRKKCKKTYVGELYNTTGITIKIHH